MGQNVARKTDSFCPADPNLGSKLTLRRPSRLRVVQVVSLQTERFDADMVISAVDTRHYRRQRGTARFLGGQAEFEDAA